MARRLGRRCSAVSLLLLVGLATLAPCTAASLSSSPRHDVGSDGWELVFEDNFDGPNGTLPDDANWDYEVGYIRNHEMQYYTNRSTVNTFVADGNLHLRALDEPTKVEPDGRLVPVTSGSIFTKKSFTYGRIDGRLKVPPGIGVWPAFWMLGVDIEEVGWPRCGEVDIMEFVGFDPGETHATFHYEANNSMRSNEPSVIAPLANITTDFNVYSAEWTPEKVTLSVNGNALNTVYNDGRCSTVTWPFGKPFNIKLNLAIGGTWGGQQGVQPSIFPAEFVIDYVRVYQPATPSPPAEPLCSEEGTFYAELTCLDTKVNFPSVGDAVNSVPSVMASLESAVVDAVGTLLDVSIAANSTAPSSVWPPLSPAGQRVVVQSVAPRGPATGSAQTTLVIRFTVHGMPVATVAERLANTTAAATAFRYVAANLTAAYPASNPQWQLLGVSNQCPGACTNFPFQDFTTPTTVPFVKYDHGGEGVGYHDLTTWNQYGDSVSRSGPDGVDIDGAVDGIGYAVPGEFLRYSSIRVAPCSTATAALELLVTAGNELADPGIVAFNFTRDGAPAAFVQVPVLPTRGWRAFEQSSPMPLELACGATYQVTVTFPVSSYLLQSFTIRPAAP